MKVDARRGSGGESTNNCKCLCHFEPIYDQCAFCTNGYANYCTRDQPPDEWDPDFDFDER